MQLRPVTEGSETLLGTTERSETLASLAEATETLGALAELEESSSGLYPSASDETPLLPGVGTLPGSGTLPGDPGGHTFPSASGTFPCLALSTGLILILGSDDTQTLTPLLEA